MPNCLRYILYIDRPLYASRIFDISTGARAFRARASQVGELKIFTKEIKGGGRKNTRKIKNNYTCETSSPFSTAPDDAYRDPALLLHPSSLSSLLLPFFKPVAHLKLISSLLRHRADQFVKKKSFSRTKLRRPRRYFDVLAIN